MSRLAAVILAGGEGIRIRHLHPDLPKPMIPVGGEPFLHWVLAHLAGQGVGRVVVSAGYRAESIERWIEKARILGLELSCVRESEPLGTAGACVFAARSLALDGDEVVLVLNGDSIAVADLAPLLALARDPSCEAALLGVEVEDASRFGSLDVSSRGQLVAFREKKPGRGLVNAGVYALRGEAIARFPGKTPLSFEVDLFPSLLRDEKRVLVARTSAPFIDIGVPESLAAADAFVTRHLAGT
ncbi:NTP transferase domain-containing protein [bacterium]|nr:NTP transferase domain-containing protein [bacterium]